MFVPRFIYIISVTGLRVESYGTGTQVRLPGRTAMGELVIY